MNKLPNEINCIILEYCNFIKKSDLKLTNKLFYYLIKNNSRVLYINRDHCPYRNHNGYDIPEKISHLRLYSHTSMFPLGINSHNLNVLSIIGIHNLSKLRINGTIDELHIYDDLSYMGIMTSALLRLMLVGDFKKVYLKRVTVVKDSDYFRIDDLLRIIKKYSRHNMRLIVNHIEVKDHCFIIS